jgi:hypothetical protein
MNVDIANILKGYVETLPFAGKVGGLVKPITYVTQNDKGTVKKTIPVDCGVTHENCLKGRYTDLMPDSKYKSVMYFEDGGVTPGDNNARDFSFESNLKLVCWLNLKKLGKTGCSNTALAIVTILNTIPTRTFNSGIYTRIQVTITGEEVKSPQIFSKYTYDEEKNQFLIHPYDYFALNVSVKFNVSKSCITNWANGSEINCVDNGNE